MEELWSLRNVSFEVPAGAVFGIIGRNGAGKSTLLRIVTRIAEPTSGRTRTRGRVGSLLEIGTGFHPDLTGRENVYLNGAVLGMSRREVHAKMEQIVDFSGMARFLDTPVKRYSSGMYMRLAFSVAAHLDAEILVIDEVLAVGDIEFQNKCLGKMSEMGGTGRTVLFVSHNLDAVRRLCDRSLWLDHGVVQSIGPTAAVIDAYASSGISRAGRKSFAPTPGPVVLTEAAVLDARGEPEEMLARDEPFTVEVSFTVREPVTQLDLTAVVTDLRGNRLLDEALSDSGTSSTWAPGSYTARLEVPPVLNVGDYTVSLWFGDAYQDLVWEEAALRFRLHGSAHNRTNRLLQLGLSWQVVPGVKTRGPASA
jgi:ABC-2 type transport system ATP-binding protein/lipopolysaccharide transport system ATP-binding protein